MEGRARASSRSKLTWRCPSVADGRRHARAYRDPRGRWTSTRVSYFSIAYDTSLVPPDQVPKTYDDLLDPRWRGKLAWRIGTSSGTPLFLTTIRLARGEAKAAEIAASSPRRGRSTSDRQRAHASRSRHRRVHRAQLSPPPADQQGKVAPVNSQLMDPVASTAGTMIVPKACAVRMRAVADRFHPVPGRTRDHRRCEYFPVRPDVHQGRAGFHHSGARRRAGAVRELGPAQSVYRALAKDF